MRWLRSETPLRRQKGSLRKEFRLLRKAAGALPLSPAALTGRFASLRARGLRPAFEKA